jgi:hypothetical protein
VKRLAALLVATLLALAAIEGGLRLWTVLPPAPLFESAGDGRLVTSSAWPVIGRVELNESPKRLRIVWMGASTVQGVPFQPVVSPPRWLDLILAWRGVRAEVIPVAGSGLDATRLASFMPDVLALQPDAIVITTGHNEYLRTGELLDKRWWHSLQLGWRLNMLIEGAARQVGRMPTIEHDFDHDAIIGNLRDRLAEMNALTAEAGVPLVMTVPVCNLADFPPALGDDPRIAPGPDAAWSLGQEALDLGNTRAALEAFEYARDHDRWPHRATERVIATVKESARVLVPIDRIIRDASESGSPGFDLFMDHCHPNLEGQRLLALATADVLEDLRLFEATGLRGQAPPAAEVLPRFGVNPGVRKAAEARTGRALVRFALLSGKNTSGRAGNIELAARDMLLQVQASAEAPIAEIEANLLLLELKIGEVDAARGRLASARRDNPASVQRLQYLHDTYPWVREVFEENGFRLFDGELLSLRRLP